VSTKVLWALGANEENLKNAVKIANPISSETEYLRTFIWPNLIEVIAKNMKQGYKDIAIFEIGKVYSPGPKESYRLSIALMNGGDNPIEELIVISNKVKDIIPVELSQGGLMKELETLFHPNRFATIKAGEKVIGGIAEVHPRFLNNFGVEKRVAILEISIENLI
jgi:phenylalanyl-tRNA synthetase beta chain